MDEEQAAHHLLNVLEERGLDVDLDKILLGFEEADTKHDVATWVEEYLHEDTLLTKEELELYAYKGKHHERSLIWFTDTKHSGRKGYFTNMRAKASRPGRSWTMKLRLPLSHCKPQLRP